MKISIYLKAGSVITCEANASPELEVSQFTGKLMAYNITGIVGNVYPVYIDPSEIVAVVTETTDSERT